MADTTLEQSLKDLVNRGAITQEQLFTILADAERNNDRMIGDILLAAGLLPKDIVKTLVELGYEEANLQTRRIPVEVIRLLPEQLARRYKVMPLYLDGNTLVVATFNPTPQLEQYIRVAIGGRPIRWAVAEPDEIMDAINHGYQRAVNVAAPLEQVLKMAAENAVAAAVTGGDNSPVAQTVSLIIRQGRQLRASDVHLEPQPPNLRIRYRVDGVMQDGGVIPMKLAGPVISRIRIMANLDVVEHNIPQDGQFAFVDEGDSIDIRVSILPTVHGPKVVMRLLDKAKTMLSLTQLGYEERQLDLFRQMVRAPFGMVLVVGPTGSGKSTTLYATVGETDTMHLNVQTLEDPVEYRVGGITQTQVNPKAGLTFAAGLRSLMRQDPDVIILGEIRDQETADIAFRAAMTGHLVLSTLHAMDTVATIGRLIDIGVEPYIISAALNGAVSQRLIRKICPRCAAEQPITPQERAFLQKIGVTMEKQRVGVGCTHCNFTGYRGREAVAEVLVIREEMRRLISRNASVHELRQLALSQGLVTLQQSAVRKIRQGITTVQEVMRAVYV